MTSNWRTYIVSELEKAGLLRVEDGNHGEYRPRQDEFAETGTPFIRAADMDRGRIFFESASRINETALSRIRKGIGSPGDTLLSSKGTVGKVALAPLDCESFVCSPQVTFWRSLDNNFLDYRFLYYYIQSSEFWLQVAARSGETDMAPYISLTNQREFKIAIPQLDEQKAIAHILGTLDDKIELNQQMNRTLEAIARAIFKSWFVDFDPVRAKMDGRQPVGMDAATADLFPDKFEDSPLGKIPKGWKVGRLDDLLVLQRGFDLPTSQRIPGKYPVIAASGSSGTHAEYKVKGPGVVTGRSGLLGKVFFVHEDFWPLNTSLWVKEFRISRPLHAYHLLRGLEFETFNSGSAVPTLNRNHVHNIPVIVPPISVVEAFETLVIPMFRNFRENDKQASTLADIRDALLPKLLSGEIRIKEAEKLVGDSL